MIEFIKKFWFSSLFVLLSAISVGALFGYRISLTDQVIEKKGVLFLEGSHPKVQITLGEKTIESEIPYLNSNITPGTYTLKVEKKGFVPYIKNVAINVDKATHLKIDFAPLPDRITRQEYTDSEELTHLFINQKYFFEFYKSPKLIAVFENAASLKLRKPDHVFSIKSLAENEKIQGFKSFKDDKFLMRGTAFWYICSITSNSCTQVEGSAQDTLIVDQETLLRLPEYKSKLVTINEFSGASEKILLEEKNISAQLFAQYTLPKHDEPKALYASTTGSGVVLKKNLFGFTSFENAPVSSVAARVFQGQYVYQSNSGGILSTLPLSFDIMPQVHMLYTNDYGIYAVAPDSTIYGIRNNARESLKLTTLNKQPRFVFFEPGKLFGYIATTTDILFCEAEKVQYCTTLATLPKEYQDLSYAKDERYFLYSTMDAQEGKKWHMIFLPPYNEEIL